MKTLERNATYRLKHFRVNFIDSQNMTSDRKAVEELVKHIMDVNAPEAAAKVD